MVNLPPIHPGVFLKEELEARGMLANHLAHAIAVPANRISQIIAGRRNITGDTALRLGHYFGTGAQVWMNLQSLYELALARREAGADIATLPTLREDTVEARRSSLPSRR